MEKRTVSSGPTRHQRQVLKASQREWPRPQGQPIVVQQRIRGASVVGYALPSSHPFVHSLLMTDCECLGVCQPAAAFPSHSLGSAERSFDRRMPVEGPWAYWACSCQACADFVAFLVCQLVEACADRPNLQVTRPGRRRRRRFPYRAQVLERSNTPIDGIR